MNWENGYQADTEFTVDNGAGYDTKAMSMVRVPRRGGNGDPRLYLQARPLAPVRTTG